MTPPVPVEITRQEGDSEDEQDLDSEGVDGYVFMQIAATTRSVKPMVDSGSCGSGTRGSCTLRSELGAILGGGLIGGVVHELFPENDGEPMIGCCC